MSSCVSLSDFIQQVCVESGEFAVMRFGGFGETQDFLQ